MENSNIRPSFNAAAGIVTLIFVGLLLYWGVGVRKEMEKIRSQRALSEAVEQGDVATVLAAIDIIDPSSRGSAADWTGRPELGGDTGFLWLLSMWQEAGHLEATEAAIRHWSKKKS